MRPNMTDAERTLIHEALRFAVWAAGEGIEPAKGEDARGPEDFLFYYPYETDDEDWATLPDRILSALAEKDKEIAAIRDALEHVTELLVDTWDTKMDGDPELQVAVKDARAALNEVGR